MARTRILESRGSAFGSIEILHPPIDRRALTLRFSRGLDTNAEMPNVASALDNLCAILCMDSWCRAVTRFLRAIPALMLFRAANLERAALKPPRWRLRPQSTSADAWDRTFLA